MTGGGLMGIVGYGVQDKTPKKRYSTLKDGEILRVKWVKKLLIIKRPGQDSRNFQRIIDDDASGWCCMPYDKAYKLKSDEKTVGYSIKSGDIDLKADLKNAAPAFDDEKAIYVIDSMDNFAYKYAVRTYYAYSTGTIDWDDVFVNDNESPEELKARCEADIDNPDAYHEYFEVSEPFKVFELQDVKCEIQVMKSHDYNGDHSERILNLRA